MSVPRFIADQRANYQVPHTLVCTLLGVSLAFFYTWFRRFRRAQSMDRVGHASTTVPRKHSSPPSSGRPCPGTSSTPQPKPGPSSTTAPTAFSRSATPQRGWHDVTSRLRAVQPLSFPDAA